LEILVDRNAAAIVCLEAGGGKVKLIDVALTADGVEQRVAGDFLFALEIGDHGCVGQLFNALHPFTK